MRLVLGKASTFMVTFVLLEFIRCVLFIENLKCWN